MGMAGRQGFDVNRLSTGTKILTVSTFLYFIDSFLPWQKVCFGGGTIFGAAIPRSCASLNLWHGVGFIAGLLAIAILVEEGLKIAGVSMGQNVPVGAIVLGLAGGLLVFTILKVLIDNEAIAIFAWIGLILSLAVAYGGYMRFQEEKTMAPPPPAAPPPPPGGMTP